MTENGRSDPKGGKTGLSTTTVRSVHLMLRNTLERVRKEKVITANPTEDCIPQKYRKKPSDPTGKLFPSAVSGGSFLCGGLRCPESRNTRPGGPLR